MEVDGSGWVAVFHCSNVGDALLQMKNAFRVRDGSGLEEEKGMQVVEA